MDAALVTAWCTGIGGIIGAIALLVKIITTRPRLPVADEVMLRLAEIEDRLLGWAAWAHDARTTAALQGYDLPPIPAKLLTPMHPTPPRLAPPTATKERS